MVTEMREFQEAQRVFREQHISMREFDFADQGRVTVRSITLDGFPGNSYLRCVFDYQNRTKTPLFQAWVSLDVLDGAGNVASTQSVRCIMPTGSPIARGSYFGDELRTPTYNVHLQPGWSWQLRVQADPEVDDEPLDPPVPPRTVREVPPMIIKDRSR